MFLRLYYILRKDNLYPQGLQNVFLYSSSSVQRSKAEVGLGRSGVVVIIYVCAG